MSWEAIQKKYGADGIRSYELDFETGTAVFSDDTQMSLFTANGILIGETQWHLKGIQGPIAGYVHIAYEEWLKMQQGADDLCYGCPMYGDDDYSDIDKDWLRKYCSGHR